MAINQEIISTSWEGQQKSYIEAGMKTLLQRMLEVLESPLAANSVGSNQLTQELRDVINSIGSKVPNTRTVNRQPLNADVTIGPGDIMVGNQTLADKLDDMDEAIGQGGDTSGLATRIAALESSLNTLTGANDSTQIIDTFNEVIDFLNNVYNDETLLGKLQQLQTQINTKANDNAVVKSISVNGGTPQTPQNGNVNIQVQTGSTISPATDAPIEDGTANVGSSAKYAREDHVHPHDTTKLSKSDVSVETQGDGTFVIHVGETDYTINLNHTHENMAKLIVCEESDLPSTLAKDTIYCQVDDADTPTEIQSLWIAGLEFVGGGGAADDTPKLTSPRNGTTIDFDGQSTTTLVVKGRNLTSNLSLVVTGDFTVTANGQSVSTIAAADVTDGASVSLLLTKGSGFVGGTIVIRSADLDEDVTLNISDSSVVVALTGVKFTGTQWLQANYYPNPKTEFQLDMELMSNENTDDDLDPPQGPCPYILSCENEGSNRFSFMMNVAGAYKNNLSCYNNTNAARTNIPYSSISNILGRSTMQYSKNGSEMVLSYKGKSATMDLKQNTMLSKLAIGYSYYFDKAIEAFDMIVYGLNIIEDGVVVRNYVPMRRYGTPGLYDTKTGEFITSKTNDPLVEVNS